eukprot:3118969-Prymnesium_polylepis.1
MANIIPEFKPSAALCALSTDAIRHEIEELMDGVHTSVLRIVNQGKLTSEEYSGAFKKVHALCTGVSVMKNHRTGRVVRTKNTDDILYRLADEAYNWLKQTVPAVTVFCKRNKVCSTQFTSMMRVVPHIFNYLGRFYCLRLEKPTPKELCEAEIDAYCARKRKRA